MQASRFASLFVASSLAGCGLLASDDAHPTPGSNEAAPPPPVAGSTPGNDAAPPAQRPAAPPFLLDRNADLLGLSSSGSHVAWERQSAPQVRSLRVRALQPGASAVTIEDIAAGSSLALAGVALSADGRFVAYRKAPLQDAAAFVAPLYVAPTDGSHPPVQVTGSSLRGNFTFWPDRSVLLYVEDARGADAGASGRTYHRYDVATGADEVIAPASSATPYSNAFGELSPNHQKILLRDAARVFVYSADTRLVADVGLSTNPIPSDGLARFMDDAHVAVVERPGPAGARAFAVWSLDTSTVTRHAVDTAAWGTALSASGRVGLVFRSEGAETGPVELVDLSTGGRTIVGARVESAVLGADDRYMLLTEVDAAHANHRFLVNARTLERRAIDGAQGWFSFGARGTFAQHVTEDCATLEVLDLSASTGAGVPTATLPRTRDGSGCAADYLTFGATRELLVRQPGGALARVDVGSGRVVDLPGLSRSAVSPSGAVAVALDEDSTFYRRSHSLYALGTTSAQPATLLASRASGGLAVSAVSDHHAIYVATNDLDTSTELWATELPTP